MDKKEKNILPIEFQKIKLSKRTNQINKMEKLYIDINFYQSCMIIPEKFYKHISKIIKF